MDIFSDFVSELPLISNVIEVSRKCVADGKSLANAKENLTRFLQSSEPVAIMNKCVLKLAEHPDADPPFMREGHIMLCNDFGGLIIALGKTEAAKPTSPLYSSTAEALIGAISDEGFSYRLHDTPDEWNPDVFSPDIEIGPPDTLRCGKGEAVVASTSMVYDYASNDAIVLKVVAPSRIGLMWEFDRETRKALRVHASTLESTTLSFILKFLSKYGNSDSVRAIDHLLAHPFHHVRWDVAKALGQLDIDALSNALTKLKDDPHPHIKAASQKMLAQLGEDNGN